MSRLRRWDILQGATQGFPNGTFIARAYRVCYNTYRFYIYRPGILGEDRGPERLLVTRYRATNIIVKYEETGDVVLNTGGMINDRTTRSRLIGYCSLALMFERNRAGIWEIITAGGGPYPFRDGMRFTSSGALLPEGTETPRPPVPQPTQTQTRTARVSPSWDSATTTNYYPSGIPWTHPPSPIPWTHPSSTTPIKLECKICHGTSSLKGCDKNEYICTNCLRLRPLDILVDELIAKTPLT